MNSVSDLQRRRAINQIWNGAQDHSIAPDVKAYDSQGNAELYWNTILGAARRLYDYPKLAAVFRAFEQYDDAEVYEGLLWLGLENAIYGREVSERPVLERLRRDYAERFVREQRGCAPDDYHLYDFLAYSHYLRILGKEPVMGPYDKKLLDELEFSPDLDTDAIVALAKDLFSRWFQIRTEERKREHHLPLLPLRRKNTKGKGRYRRFGVGLLDHPARAYADDGELIPVEDQLRTSMSAAELRAFIAFKYGAPLFSEKETQALEKQLCTGDHGYCHLHFTDGSPMEGKIQNAFEALKKEQERKQIERNRRSYREHLAAHRTAIARLAGKIQNSMLLYLQPTEIRADSGRLDGGKIWRGLYLDDAKVFRKTEQGDMGELSVDILLDASTSQAHRQESVSAQGFIIAEALTRCGISCRVMSFCSMTGYTILRVFRDYGAPQDNSRIFDYVSNGCNRDGLAIRAAHELIRRGSCEHKILIVLSDVKPHDGLSIPSDDGADSSGYRPYDGDAGIRDTAIEVRRARADGIAVICVFTGDEADLPNARLVYGKDMASIQSIDKLADAVGTLLQMQIRAI